MKKLWFATIILLFGISTLGLADLQIYIPFDEGQGDTAEDATGNEHDAVFQDAEWTNGHEGQAVKFNGGPHVEIPYPDNPDIFNSNFTFTMWINAPLTGNTWQQLLRCHPFDGTGRNSLFINNGGFLSWRGFSGGSWTAWSEMAAGSISADKWTFIAVSGDTNNIRQYVGGDLVQEDEFMEGDGGIGEINLGGETETPGETYSGSIDEFALWNETLSDNVIGNIMDSGVSSFMAVDSAGKLATTWASIRTSD